jgi:hypothetical protein
MVRSNGGMRVNRGKSSKQEEISARMPRVTSMLCTALPKSVHLRSTTKKHMEAWEGPEVVAINVFYYFSVSHWFCKPSTSMARSSVKIFYFWYSFLLEAE